MNETSNFTLEDYVRILNQYQEIQLEKDQLERRIVIKNKLLANIQEEYEEAQNKIEKAINYCERYMYTYGIKNNAQQRDELLKILKGEENE